MAKKLKTPGTGLYPVPAVLVTCCDEKGKANIITLAWVGVVCSEPPQISIAIRPSRYSNELIKKTKEFVINIPTEDLALQTDYCGMVSGKNIDKFKEMKLTPEKASKVTPPLIKECPVNLECKVKNILDLGIHDLFIGEVVAMHVEESILDKSGKIDYSKAKPFAYIQGEYWNFKERIGEYGYSKKK